MSKPLTLAQKISRAVEFAALIHRDQVDKRGNAYILHPIRVMQRLQESVPYLMPAGVLHDVLEDGPEWTEKALEKEGLGEYIPILKIVSRKKDTESYNGFIGRIIHSKSIDAIQVKLADLNDNMDRARTFGVDEKAIREYTSLMERYQKAYSRLMEALGELLRQKG